MKKKKEPIVTKKAEPSTFGTNPRDPWSTRANISEGRGGWLIRYLRSKGLDPRFVTPNQKVSYAKSGDFLKWKNDHVLRGESFEVCPSCNEDPCACDDSFGFVTETKRMSAAVKLQRAFQREKEKRERAERLGKELMQQPPKKEVKEDTFSDTYAATQTTPNVQDEPAAERKRQLSKSARIIKSIYKKKGIKEDMYDWEKEDKSVKTYGKKPKVQQVDKPIGVKPEAAAVVTGGKTLTGAERDDIQIDPMMKQRPGKVDFDSQTAKKKY